MNIKERAIMAARDPNHLLDGQPVPVLTTLIYQYCDNDPERFEKLCNLIDIVQQKTIDLMSADLT